MITATVNIETGGPAFPILVEQADDGWAHVGMSLRDYFAAKAMQAVPMTRTSMNNKSEAKHIAVHAYVMADAMLEARK